MSSLRKFRDMRRTGDGATCETNTQKCKQRRIFERNWEEKSVGVGGDQKSAVTPKLGNHFKMEKGNLSNTQKGVVRENLSYLGYLGYKKQETQVKISLQNQISWKRLLRVPWTARRSNQSILQQISSAYSLEGLMLKLKLQYFGHLMQTDSFEKTLMLAEIEGRRRRGWQRMRWLDGITD